LTWYADECRISGQAEAAVGISAHQPRARVSLQRRFAGAGLIDGKPIRRNGNASSSRRSDQGGGGIGGMVVGDEDFKAGGRVWAARSLERRLGASLQGGNEDGNCGTAWSTTGFGFSRIYRRRTLLSATHPARSQIISPRYNNGSNNPISAVIIICRFAGSTRSSRHQQYSRYSDINHPQAQAEC
jgi:hypothetical protein